MTQFQLLVRIHLRLTQAHQPVRTRAFLEVLEGARTTIRRDFKLQKLQVPYADPTELVMELLCEPDVAVIAPKVLLEHVTRDSNTPQRSTSDSDSGAV